MTGTAPRSHFARSADWLAAPLLLVTPLAGFLRFHEYGLWRPEVAVAALLLAALGLALAGLARLRPATLQPALLGTLLFVAGDVQFRWMASLRETLADLVPGAGGLLPIVALAFFLVVLGLCWRLRGHLADIVVAAVAAMLAGSLLLPVGRVAAGTAERPAAAEAAADLPPVLHIVLDEHIGLAGLPDEALRRDLAALYERHGFTVYDRAFSNFAETQYSLASLLNGEVTPRPDLRLASAGDGFVLQANAWFEALQAAGYRLRVYQSGWLDYCATPGVAVDFCLTYPTNSVRSIADAALGLWPKVRLILGHLAGQSMFWPVEPPLLSTPAAFPVLERVRDDLLAAPRGTAVFAHLLMPHHAYAYDQACRLKDDIADWHNVGLFGAPDGVFNTPVERARKYRAYLAQIRCLGAWLDAFFAALDAAGVLDGAVVVIHGDHGSRLALRRYALLNPADLSERDVVDQFSTLFAVRLPPGRPTGDPGRMASVQDLFAELFLGRPPAPAHPEVYLRAPRGEPFRARPMVTPERAAAGL